MTCMEAQKQMNSFLYDKLEKEELEAFVSHILDCDSCRDDLEVYYTLFSGIRMLDDTERDTFCTDFDKRLKRAEDQIRRNKMFIVYKQMLLFFFFFFLAFWL